MPTQNTGKITEVDRSQPLLHQHGYEIQQYGTLRDLPIVLNPSARSESCVLVNQILADTIILYHLYKKPHWLMRGHTFYQLHLLLDKHASEQIELIDALGEQFFFGPIQFLSPGYAPADFGFTGAVSLTRLQNIGSVTLRSPDPKDPPTIQMNYLQSQADVQKLVEGVKLIRQLFQTSAFDDFHGEEIAPGSHVQSDAALEAYIRDTCSTVWHPVGTCKMGIDSMAVVDPQLRVHGIQGLRVVDASIMPTITTGNTNAPTIMIAEKAADLIKAERTSQSFPNKLNVENLSRLSI